MSHLIRNFIIFIVICVMATVLASFIKAEHLSYELLFFNSEHSTNSDLIFSFEVFNLV